MRPFLSALAVLAALGLRTHAADLRFFDDAPLRAVQFVDANEGWAVGDEGVVWHTIDGGKSWERQPTGVRASLRAVNFLNPFTGWVVGREELPYGGGSVGVVLMTRDGGLKWQRVSTNALPGLNCVRFFDDKFGIVAGDGSDLYPSGAFTTADGGRGWKPLAAPRCPSWLSADFHQDAQSGALAGSWSRLATLRKGTLGAADVDTLGGRSLFGLQLIGQQAVAVGQGGLVLVSATSAGLRWGFADLKLPSEVLASVDFHAVCSRGDQVWVVGRPGSVVLHSHDRGQTWSFRKTGQPLPLHGIFFLNEQRGWAVGELGTVLTTSDGGRNWTVQRQGGQRAAVLFLTARPHDLPLETVALLGADDGYLITALRVTASDPASASPSRSSESQRLAQAMRRSGGAAAETLWQFPLPEHCQRSSKHDLLAAWDRLHAERAAEQFLRQLVLAIRIWQPEVVVTESPQPDAQSGDKVVEALLEEAVAEAFKQAADPHAFPEQLEQLGLRPWQVKKVYGRLDEPGGASVVLDLREQRNRLEGTAREFAADAAGCLTDDSAARPTRSAYRLLASRIDGAAGHKHLLQGITLAEGGTARRTLEPLPEADPADRKLVALRRNLLAFAEAPTAGLTDPDRLLGQVGPMLRSLPSDQGAPAAFAIASQFVRSGQWNLARETFLLMVERYPAHPLSALAYRWLIRHNCSSEARRRQELGQFLLTQQSEVRRASHQQQADPGLSQNVAETVITGQVAPMRATLKGGGPESEVMQHALRELAEGRSWYKGALEIEGRLAGFGPLFAGEPAVQFCLQAARRNLGQFEEARGWYTRLVAAQPEGPWREAAAAELWLANRSGSPPKPLAFCRQTSKRPFLDGAFDDDCWQGLKPLKLRPSVPRSAGPAAPEYETEAWFAWDKEFLYLALRCRHPADRHVPPVKVRRRDEDLHEFDRVSLLLDLDRDYNTYFHLQIDQRGCLFEDCWGDRSWNPRWFVAIRSESSCWQIEAAIPLTELTGDPVTVGRAWACNLVRVLPGRGVQAWSVPADVQPRPEGMGLLLFTADQVKDPVAGNR